MNKVILCVFLSSVIVFLMNILLYVPTDIYDNFNQKLISAKRSIVKEGYDELVNFMFRRYLIFTAFSIFIFIFSIIYVSIFCTIYSSTMMSWLLGSIVSLITFFIIIQLGSPLILTLIRTLSRLGNFKYNRLVRNIFKSSIHVL